MRIVELTDKCVDYGEAPSFLATGICRIFFISRHIVRVTLVRNDVDDNGAGQQRVSGHVDCDIAQVDAILDLIHRGLGDLQPRDKPVPRLRGEAMN